MEKRVEFIEASEFEDLPEEERAEGVLEVLSRSNAKVVRIPRSNRVSREQVVGAFESVFQMIGGVPRFALWADANPTEFYRLYGKLLPQSSMQILDGKAEMVVRHVLPPPRNGSAPYPVDETE